MNLSKSSYSSYLMLSVLLLLVTSCTINDAELPRRSYVTVYLESEGTYDSLIFRKFEKEEHIKVSVKYLNPKQILNQIKLEKYNCSADLILLNDYEALAKASAMGLFRPIESELLNQNIDPIYHSRKKKWFALSKTPIVLIYNKTFTSRDTIRNYYDLISPKWKGKLAFQEPKNSTLFSFRRTVKLIMKERADSFLIHLKRQSILPNIGNDDLQISRILNREATFSLVKLASLAQYHQKEMRFKNKGLSVQPIFPNQRKKGCYMTISGAGVYKYAANPSNAIKLLEFLSSKRAQYYYAAGRMHSPLLKGVPADILLNGYGKFRGRFYRKRFKVLKKD